MGQRQPLEGRHTVLRNHLPFHQHLAQRELRGSEALIGAESKPARCRSTITPGAELRETVHGADDVLIPRRALFRRSRVPFPGTVVALRHPVAIRVQPGQRRLCVHEPVFGSLANQFGRA